MEHLLIYINFYTVYVMIKRPFSVSILQPGWSLRTINTLRDYTLRIGNSFVLTQLDQILVD